MGESKWPTVIFIRITGGGCVVITSHIISERYMGGTFVGGIDSSGGMITAG